METESNTRTSDDSPLIPLRELIIDTLDGLSKMENETYLPGLSTGFSAIDHVISGLNKSDLIVLASRPSMGKTSLALSIALNVARNSGAAVAIFSLAASKEQLAMQLLSMQALVDSYRIKTGQLDKSDWKKITVASELFSATEILIDDNPILTVENMKAKCQNIANLGFIVIDDLQFITSSDGNKNPNESRYETVSAILRRLKVMAKELKIPLLCLSQVNRANEKREDKRPQLSDLRDSGVIEDYADVVMFLYRDDYYNEYSENHNVAECIIAKNRHGITGTVHLRWMPHILRLRA